MLTGQEDGKRAASGRDGIAGVEKRRHGTGDHFRARTAASRALPFANGGGGGPCAGSRPFAIPAGILLVSSPRRRSRDVPRHRLPVQVKSARNPPPNPPCPQGSMIETPVATLIWFAIAGVSRFRSPFPPANRLIKAAGFECPPMTCAPLIRLRQFRLLPERHQFQQPPCRVEFGHVGGGFIEERLGFVTLSREKK